MLLIGFRKEFFYFKKYPPDEIRLRLCWKSGEILPPVSSELSSQTAALKERANAEYNAKNYADAIHFYNLALVRRKHPVLLSNRAAATLKRNW